jgi:hypothetical protein
MSAETGHQSQRHAMTGHDTDRTGAHRELPDRRSDDRSSYVVYVVELPGLQRPGDLVSTEDEADVRCWGTPKLTCGRVE